MVYVTSDLHFSHNKPFLYEPRGFSSPKEHNEEIVRKWNLMISDDDEVYILGDLIMSDNEDAMKYLSQLKGKIYFIRGNHDTDTKIALYKSLGFTDLGYAHIIKSGKWSFYLSHYPTAVGNYDDEETHKKFYCLCGHTHTADRWKDFNTMKSYHVELDAHDNFPVTIEQIKMEIQDYTPAKKEIKCYV